MLVPRLIMWALVVPVLKRFVPLPNVARLMWVDCRTGTPDRERQKRIVRATRRILRASPLTRDENCLDRSLVLYRFLSMEKLDPRLVIGVRSGPEGPSGHAWVTVEGKPVVEPSVADYAPMAIIGPAGAVEVVHEDRSRRVPGAPASVRAASVSLLLDACAAEVVGRFDQAGIDSVLLRGPALTSWLYDEHESRPYTDVDLLVSSDQLINAEAALQESGFTLLPLPPLDQHARTWVRADGASVDLHKSVSGVTADADVVWSTLKRDAQTLTVHGRAIAVPSLEARALMVALHVTQHGRQLEQPLEDLSRALERAEVTVWRSAAELAAALGALPAFASGLRRLASGSELADDLGLPLGDSVTSVLRAGNPPNMSLGIDWLASRKGARAKLHFAARKLFPSPAFMRAWSSLANRGRLGLVASYVQRWFWVTWHAVPAVRAWVAARRQAAR